MNANMIIINNINKCLKSNKKKQADLAEAMGVSRQTISKILTGARSINAVELKQIADFCKTTMDALVAVPKIPLESDVVRVFMGKVKTAEAKKGIELADELIELFLFHDKVHENAVVQMDGWSDLA